MIRVVVVVALLIPEISFAAAWKLEVQGAHALGSGYADGAAGTGDASTVWFNPAGMMDLDGTLVTVGAPVIDLSIRWEDEGSTSLLGSPLVGSRSQQGGATVAVPHLYLTRRMSNRFALGFGFNTPFGLGTDYGSEWVGRYHAGATELIVFNANPAVAFALTPRLAVGAGLNIQYMDARFTTAIDFGSIGTAVGIPLPPQETDGGVEITGSDLALGFNAGVLWKPSDTTRIGVAYRSNTTAAIQGPARFDVPRGAELLTQGGLVFAETRAHTELPMPESWSIGLQRNVSSRVSLLADFTWTHWSRFENLTVGFENPLQPPIRQPADWDDTLRISVGAEFDASHRWVLRFGYADEPTPVPDATREPRIPEADHTWATIGATWKRSPRYDLDFFLVHLTTDRAPVVVADPTAGTLKGNLPWNIWTFGIGSTVRF